MSNKNVLVVAAHPDDEILGCGGSMVKHVKQNDEVHVLILAEGITARDAVHDRHSRSSDLELLHQNAMRANCQIIGVRSCEINNFPDNRMDSVHSLDIVKIIEQKMAHVRPNIVYTHHGGDVNIDHRCVHDAVIVACRSQPDSTVKTLLFFEIPSSTEWQTPGARQLFVPNWYIDISTELTTKLDAMKIYEQELRPYPHTRSLEAIEFLAKWRGATIGVEAAESFMLGRCIR